ncbi:MAG: sugar kinase [Candidatus Omnitrophica bacterium]|nr:sugar kinase [Candidatus Omnitrophota bacterium]
MSFEFDLVALGETMIRHYTRAAMRLEQCADLGFSIAGSESNLTIAAARLGLKTAWISKLPKNPLGEKIAREIAVHGVDLSRVAWAREGRAGVFYIESGSPPRPTQVLYDRKGSAASTLSPEEIDWDFVRRSKWFHTTGITCALSASCLETVKAATHEAHRGQTLVSLEVNYREKLWSTEQCRKTLTPLAGEVDLLVTSSEDVERVFQIQGDGTPQGSRFREAFGIRRLLMTCGGKGALFIDQDGGCTELSFDRFPVTVVDRIGTGDAFTAGFFSGWLERDAPTGLLYGAAACALKYSIPGDLALISREEMLAVAAGDKGGIKR